MRYFRLAVFLLLLATCSPGWLLSQGGPNLTPFQPTGWSGKIVISSVTGTHLDGSTLTTANTLYFRNHQQRQRANSHQISGEALH
jgi:hypothetical protein